MSVAVSETVMVPLGQLNPYPANPRKGDIEAIVESLRHHGQYRAIVVNRPTMQVLAGNHTLHALHEIGAKDALVHFVDVSEDEAARIVLVDNRTNDKAGYDQGLLAELLQSLPDLSGTGWDTESLDGLLATLSPGNEIQGDPDDVPDPPAIPVTQPGDLWLLGEHRLLCGDSTSAADVLRLMDGKRADLVFTDPPYGVGYTGGAKPREALQADEPGTTIYGDSLPNLKQAAADHAALYLWYADAHAAAAAAAAAAAGYEITAQIIWVKNNAQFVTAAHYKGKHEPCFYAHRKGKTARWTGPNNEVTVWEVDRANRNDFHPTQKPVELVERAIRNSSNPRDIVLDLFGGSGSTAIAAHESGRIAYLMEIDPTYCDVICARFEQATGIAPIRSK